jgi:hypothetical protein
MADNVTLRRIPIGICLPLLWVAAAHGQTVDAANPSTANSNAAPARAQSFLYGADVGIGESDNVTLVQSNKVSQTIAITDLDLDIKDQTRRFDVDAKGNFSYLDYLQGAYDNQLVGRFDGRADVAVIPDHLTWVLTDNFGQGQIDPFTASVPTNLQNINYLSTGPDVAFRFGPTFFLDLSARYAKTNYQTDPFDNSSVLGNLAFGRTLSAQSSVSVNGSFERMTFDDTAVNTNFDRSSVYGHYEIQGARTNLSANLGATKVEQGEESFTGPDAKLQIQRKLSSASTLTLTLGRGITDGSTSFSNLQAGAIGGIPTAPGVLSQSNYTVTSGSVAWDYSRNRTAIGVSGTWEKDTYEGLPLQDVTRATAEFRVERKLTRVLIGQLSGRLYRTEYANTDFSETDGFFGGALLYRPGRGLEIKLRYDHSSRNASGLAVVPGVNGNYGENRAFLTIGYRPRVAQSM